MKIKQIENVLRYIHKFKEDDEDLHDFFTFDDDDSSESRRRERTVELGEIEKKNMIIRGVRKFWKGIRRGEGSGQG